MNYKKVISKQVVKKVVVAVSGTAIAVAQFASVMVSPVYSQAYTPQAAVSFTFDDGLASTYTRALPILKDRGIKGVEYHNTSYTGKSGYMSWSQLQDLQNKYGWEVGSHSVTHPLMSTLSDSQIKYEVEQSKKDLISHGINPVSFATPYGDYDNRVVGAIAKQYSVHRPFQDRELDNTFPYNQYMVNVQSIEKSTTMTQVKSWVDHAKATNTWLVLVVHEVVSSKASDQYDVTESMLKQVADYVKSSGVRTTTVKDMYQINQTNMFQNSSFESGVTSGWIVDNASQVKIDTNTNGAMPNPKTVVALTGTSTAVHLFSQKVSVSANNTYALKAFVNQANWKKGEYGFYIDEYDAQGNWISGRWLRGFFDNDTNKSNDINEVGYLYQPTSWDVSTAMLEVYMTAGSSGKVYVDNIEMYKVFTDSTMTPPPSSTPTPTPSMTATPTATASATPSVTPTATASATPRVTPTATPSPTSTVRSSTTPTPTVRPSATPTATATATPRPTTTAAPTVTPVPSSMVKNGGFGSDENGFAKYWSTDNSSYVVYDPNSNGCAGSNSIRFLANNTSETHLFADEIAVDSTKTYLWETCVKVGSGTGEFGYYIDELDSNGNWISGQWLGAAEINVTASVKLTYKPTSSNVKKVVLQYYKDKNSTFTVNVDEVYFNVK